MKDMQWMDLAACKDHPEPDRFFPSSPGKAGKAQAEAAALICKTCPVTVPCAAHRKDTGATAGVWGGSATRFKNAGPSAAGDPRKGGAHGTEAAYRRHLRAGEKACVACLAAHSARQSPNGRSRTQRWSA